MAPEQARGRTGEVDARTDVWAVGALAFWLLAGRKVHEAETANELVIAAATQPPPRVEAFVDGLPPRVSGLVNRALALDPSQRFQDATTMQAAVDDALSSLPPAELDRSPERRTTAGGRATLPESDSSQGGASTGHGEGSAGPRPRRSRGWPAALGLGALIGGSVAAFAAWLPREPHPPPGPLGSVLPVAAAASPPSSGNSSHAVVTRDEALPPAPPSAVKALLPPDPAPVTPGDRVTETPARRPTPASSRPARAVPLRPDPVDLLDVRE
jgi:serine/threonine-protein kinase